MPKTHKKRKSILNLKNRAPRLLTRLLFNKRAISVALSTLIITAGVIAMGIAVLYWTYAWGNIAINDSAENIQTQASVMGERIAFEYVNYASSIKNVTVSLINWGTTDNVTIARVYIWNSTDPAVATFGGNDTILKNIDTQAPLQYGVNVGEDGYLNLHITTLLTSGSYYNIQVVTTRGRNFDSSFIA